MTKKDTDTYLLHRGGQILAGRYRVKELLGVGGMGSVWTAEQIALRREVVVKFHEAGFAGMGGERALKRFHREVHALASVRHRNVAELYESGTAPTGEPYLIMEKLEGEPLSRPMQSREPLPLAWVCDVVIGIGRGLEAVHQAGVVHRDVKPENIFLHRDEGVLVPKLLDFGLAREDDPRGPKSEATITGRRSAIGTPGYMSPEQALAAQDIDGRADQYGLAVCAYEMLTGRLPARGRDAKELLRWTLKHEAIPIHDRRPDLDPDVAVAIMRALAFDRGRRYPRIRDFTAAIERVREELDEPPAAASGARRRLPAVPPPPRGEAV